MDVLEQGDQNRLTQIALDSLHAGGYDGSLVVTDWAYADVFAPSEPQYSIEIAAFGQTPPSYRTACWGVVIGEDHDLSHLRALGAPQVLQLTPDSVVRWKIASEGLPERKQQLSPDHLVELFTENRDEWGPQSVLRLKGASPSLEPSQLDFYDTGLLPAIESVVFEKLDRALRDVLSMARLAAKEHEVSFSDERNLLQLVFRLLAAKVFSDRSYPGLRPASDAQEALANAQLIYSRDVTSKPDLNMEVADVVWRRLRDLFTLQNISVEALAHVYENTLVSDEHRRATSTHATPPYIAEYMVRRLPFESLPVDNRYVFEPFAGHAVFLVSALGRLRELLPDDMTESARHDYFVERLTGIESDPFAVEVAKLSLLLADYPNSDGWKVVEGDVFTSPLTKELIKKSNVVLANPPFRWFEKNTRANYVGLSVNNPAAEILLRILDAPPALLGLVLPSSFVSGQSYRQARSLLLEAYGEIEIMALPDKVFSHSEAPTVLLLAFDRGKHPPMFRSAAVEDDKALLKFSESWEPSWRTGPTIFHPETASPVLWRTPLSSAWDELAHYPTLNEVATIHRGIEYKYSVKDHPDLLLSKIPADGFVRGLFNVDRHFEQYYAKSGYYLNMSPDMMRRNAHLYPWSHPKVIVSASRRTRGFWRIAAVPDRTGLVCYQNFTAIWPKDDLSIEVIASVLNGYIANAFVSSNPSLRHVNIKTLKSIPVPYFDSDESETIRCKVAEYIATRVELSNGSDRASQLVQESRTLLKQIDELVLQAYRLPKEAAMEIRQLAEQAATNRPVRKFVTTPPAYLGALDSPLRQNQRSVRDLATRLRDVLGEPLAAYIADMSETDFSDWLRTNTTADNGLLERLEVVHRVVDLLQPLEGNSTIRAWFVGKNELLNDRAPAYIVKSDPNAVLEAAELFAAYG